MERPFNEFSVSFFGTTPAFGSPRDDYWHLGFMIGSLDRAAFWILLISLSAHSSEFPRSESISLKSSTSAADNRNL